MPKYVISSDSPITARAISGLHPDHTLPRPERPVDPGYGVEEGGGIWGPTDPRPTPPIVIPGRPSLPPVEEWPPLPPGIGDGGGLGDWLEGRFPPHPSHPIPPTPEHPMVPIDPPEEIDPPTIWPPLRPEFPELGGKTLALAMIFVSKHVAKLHWIVVDNDDAKEKWEKIKEALANRPQPK